MKDILLDENNDIEIKDGDFAIGDSTLQHQDLLITSPKGTWKENPSIGVGAAGFLKDEGVGNLLVEIKKEFEKDGMTFNGISIDQDKINVSANY